MSMWLQIITSRDTKHASFNSSGRHVMWSFQAKTLRGRTFLTWFWSFKAEGVLLSSTQQVWKKGPNPVGNRAQKWEFCSLLWRASGLSFMAFFWDVFGWGRLHHVMDTSFWAMTLITRRVCVCVQAIAIDSSAPSQSVLVLTEDQPQS